MSWFDGLRHRLRTVLRPDEFDAGLRDEMEFHQELDAAQQADASRARRRFGNDTYYREEVRRLTWLGALDTVRQDASHAWRSVVRAPGLTVVVVLTLGLGIGANAALFPLLDRLYLRPPAGLAEPDALHRVWIQHYRSSEPFASQSLNYPMFRALSQAWPFEDSLALYTAPAAERLGREAGAPRARVSYVTANYAGVLGIRPARGRFFTPEEGRLAAPGQVAVISHGFARRHFGEGVDPLGRTLNLGTRVLTVVGVMPREFTGIDLQPAEVWLPLGAFEWAASRQDPWWESVNAYFLRAVGRADRDASLAGFEQAATAAIRTFDRERMGEQADTLMQVLAGSIIEARGPRAPDQEHQISVRLAGVSAIVLLIACANAVNLLLARAVNRRRENAVRLALGISRWRMARLVIAETVLLALFAGITALLAAAWGGSLLRSLLLPDIEWATSTLDARVALFTFAVAVVVGIAAGIVPALQSTRTDLAGGLKAGVREGVRQRSRLRGGLVAAQAALSVVLLVGAVLFVRSLRNVQQLDIGYDTDRIIDAGLQFPLGESLSDEVRAAGLRDVARRLEQHPAIEAAARTSMRPMWGMSWLDFYTGADSLGSFAPDFPTVTAVSPAFFEAVGLRVVRGRGFEGADVDGGAPEVVVNEAMARLVWRDRDPLGACMQFETRAAPCYTVVGVVENSHQSEVIEPSPAPKYYVPLGNLPAANLAGTTLLVRADPRMAEAAGAAVQAELSRAFPTARPVMTPMLEYLEPQYRPWRLGASLFTAFGVLALVVALIGIYTAVSYGVSQRTHEFGVRMALGARVRDVIRLVIGEGLRTVGLGVLAGIVLALAAGRLVAALLYDVRPSDPAVLVLVSAGMLAVAAVAALVPASRAARTDPLATLRAD